MCTYIQYVGLTEFVKTRHFVTRSGSDFISDLFTRSEHP